MYMYLKLWIYPWGLIDRLVWDRIRKETHIHTYVCLFDHDHLSERECSLQGGQTCGTQSKMKQW